MVRPSMIDSYKYNLVLRSTPTTIKFLCSYGGKILPRHPDGKLRYHGGETRVLAVERSISFSELVRKLGEMCGTSVSLRCQLPTEDMDALISITSDEDLANLIEEYDRAASASPSSSLKVRAFLSAPKSTASKKLSPTPSLASSSSSSTPTNNDANTSPKSSTYSTMASPAKPPQCINRIIPRPAMAYPYFVPAAAKALPYYAPIGKASNTIYLILH